MGKKRKSKDLDEQTIVRKIKKIEKRIKKRYDQAHPQEELQCTDTTQAAVEHYFERRQTKISNDGQKTLDAKSVKTHGSYDAEAVSTHKMALIAVDYPATTLGEVEYVAIQGVIWDLLEAEPDPLPVVNMGGISSGAISFTCEGSSSAAWLRAQDGLVVEGVMLRVIDAKDLPNPVKTAWESGNVSRLEEGRVLRMMQRYHPGLRTTSWKILDTKVKGLTVDRIVLMDGASAAYIKAKGYCLNTGIDKSVFRLLEERPSTIVFAQGSNEGVSVTRVTAGEFSQSAPVAVVQAELGAHIAVTENVGEAITPTACGEIFLPNSEDVMGELALDNLLLGVSSTLTVNTASDGNLCSEDGCLADFP